MGRRMLRSPAGKIIKTGSNILIEELPIPLNHYGSKFVGQLVPLFVEPGSDFNVRLSFENTGLNSWGNNYNIGSAHPQDNSTWGTTRIYDSNIIDTYDIRIVDETLTAPTLTAPITAATYNFQWMMVHEGVGWFGDFSTNLEIIVTDKSHNAEFIAQDIPSTLIAGECVTGTITMKNTGYLPWTTETRFSLGSENPHDTERWGFKNRIELPHPVEPGETVIFPVNRPTPTVPGNYNFQWKMVEDDSSFEAHDGQWFGEITTNIVITLT